MAFTKLSAQEKEAFFGLLDEYFRSRPELFGQSGEGVSGGGLAGTGISTAAAASAVQHALATAGHVTTTSSASGGGVASGKSNNPFAANALNWQKLNVNEADVSRTVSAGRVAAASLAFSGSGAPQPPAPADPPTLPRRGTSSVPASPPDARVGSPGSEVDKLVSKKTSVFSAFKAPQRGGAGVVVPPAFVQPKNAFAPPPVRRVASDMSAGGAASGGAVAGTRTAARQVPPVPAAAESEEAEGEWAEVLYEYRSEDSTDLTIEAGMRVFVTAKSSEDWWTGQIEGQGREGLFPAAYVKLL